MEQNLTLTNAQTLPLSIGLHGITETTRVEIPDAEDTLLEATSKPIDLVNYVDRALERVKAIVETVANNSCEGCTSYQSIPDQRVVLLLEQASSTIDDVMVKADELWKVFRGRLA